VPIANLTERFPCENCRCGCLSAEQCWRNCCCHSVAQRLAWAEQEGVTPPDYVLAQEIVPSRMSCCQADKSGNETCCDKGAEQPSTCVRYSGAVQSKTSNEQQHEAIGWRVLACRGQGLGGLTSVPPSLLQITDLIDAAAPTSWMEPLPNQAIFGVEHCPPVPPPKFS
jgi:hypothetical protein